MKQFFRAKLLFAMLFGFLIANHVMAIDVGDEESDILEITLSASPYLIIQDTTWDLPKVKVRGKTKDELKEELEEAAREAQGNDFDQGDFDSDFEDDYGDYEPPSSATVQVIGATLTVTGGAKVEFEEDYGLEIISGSLQVLGTDEQVVTFQGLNWAGIQFDSTASTSTMEYCKIEQSQGLAELFAAIRVYDFNNLTIDNCEITNNSSFNGGGIYLSNADITITNSTFSNNNDAFLGGGIHMVNSSPTIRSNTFVSNEDVSVGGAIYMSGSSPLLEFNNFAQNIAQNGGAIFMSNSSPTFRYNIIANNESTSAGGGLAIDGSSTPTFENNTITNNLAKQGGGMYLDATANASFVNNIIYGNSFKTGGSGAQVYLGTASATASFQYNDIEGGQDEFAGNTFSGTYTNNLDVDPLFSSPTQDAGSSGRSDDWSLLASSPLINAGNSSITDASQLDFNGESVPYNSFITDMGAYEFQNNPPYLGSVGGEVAGDQEMAANPTDEDNEVTLVVCDDAADIDGHDLTAVISSLPSEGGTLYQYDDGDKGVAIQEGDQIEDSSFLVIYEPVNRRETYTDTFTCQAQDIVLDDDGEEDTSVAMTSPNKTTVSIQVFADNDSPEFTSQAPVTASVNSTVEYSIEVDDPDLEDTGVPEDGLDLLTVSVDTLPDWLTFTDSGDGTITVSGTVPESALDEDQIVTLLVTDAEGATAEQNFTLTITEQVELQVEIEVEQAGEPEEVVKLSASGSEGDTIAYEWAITDEDGAEIATGTLSSITWVPETEGVYQATVSVSDEEGSKPATATKEITIGYGFEEVAEEDREEPTAEQEQAIDDLEEENEAQDRALASARAGILTPTPRAAPTGQELVDLVGELAILKLDERQQGVLIDTITRILTNESVSSIQISQLLGAQDNLVLEESTEQVLSEQQILNSATNLQLVASETSGYSRFQLVKGYEILNELVQQKTAELLIGDLALTIDEVGKALAAQSAALQLDLENTNTTFLRWRTQQIVFADVSGDVTIAGSETNAEVVLPESFINQAEKEWGGDFFTIVVMDNDVAAIELDTVATILFFDHESKAQSISTAFTIGLPVVDSAKLTPMVYDETKQRWLTEDISNVDTSDETKVSFSARRLSDFTLLSASESEEEAGAADKAGSSVEELGSCFLDSF